MLVTFTFTCQLEPEGVNQKVMDYTMSGNIQMSLAAQLLQQIQILEAVKEAKEEAKKEVEQKTEKA